MLFAPGDLREAESEVAESTPGGNIGQRKVRVRAPAIFAQMFRHVIDTAVDFAFLPGDPVSSRCV